MSAEAASVDSLYMFLFWFSVVFTVGITVATLYFVYSYMRKKGTKAEPPLHITKLEIFWTVVPFLFIIVLFHAGFRPYLQTAIAHEGAIDIRVRASQWRWEFEYPDGTRDTELHLIVNQPYRMVISSEDVIHSFYIPEFRVKKDAIPGLYSALHFTPTQKGNANVFCAEYCGAPKTAGQAGHAGMLALVKVESKEEFQKYIDKFGDVEPTAAEGEKLFVKNACPTCHTRDGSGKGQGPEFKGLFGRTETMTDGTPIAVDENYIKESIQKPNAKTVKGYENVQMPPFAFKEKQLDALIAYIKTIK